MPFLFTPISELLPSTVPYMIKVRIARLWTYEKPERPGVITGIDMILVDEKGSRIQATLSQALCRKYQEHLEEGACRLIMNFRLIPNQGNFRGTGHPLKISFIFQSVVKPAQDIPNLDHRFHFHPFDEIVSESHDSTVFFDVIGEVIAMSVIKEVRIGARTERMLRIRLRDLGDQEIVCTLWSKLAVDAQAYVNSNKDSPVVLLGSLFKTKLSHGKTTVHSNPFASKLYFSSDMGEIRQFKQELVSTDSMVSLSQLSSSTMSNNSSLESFPRTSYMTIAEILGEPEDMLCVTLATIVSFYSEEPWFYIVCKVCFHKASPYFNPITKQVENAKHSCKNCKKDITTTSLRYKIKFRATDQTETAAFVLFDREVSELVNKSASELRQQQIERNRQAEFPQELLDIEGMFVVLKVKINSSDHGYGNSSFKVVKLSLDRSDIEKFKEEAEKRSTHVPLDYTLQGATLNQMTGDISSPSDPSATDFIQDVKKDQKHGGNSPSHVPAQSNPTEIGIKSSESSDQEVLAQPETPIHKRPLTVVVGDEAAQQCSNKRTPQSVNKPKRVFSKKEKKN